jgi:hypothetical protein
MQVGMAMKNSIEIIISATDRASSALQESSRPLKDWATKNEIPLQRLKIVGQETFSILSNKVLELTDKASKTKEAEDAMRSKPNKIPDKKILIQKRPPTKESPKQKTT